MKRFARKIIPTLILAVVAGFIVYGFWPEPIDVEIVSATRGVLRVTVEEDGKTRIREKYMVSTPVSGKLLRLALDPGDRVESGKTVLARIEPRDPTLLDARAHAEAQARVLAGKAAQRQAEAGLESAREVLELAQHDYERAQGLLKDETLSKAAFDAAEHRERIAAAGVRSAEFAQSVANFELEMAKAALIRTSVSTNGESPTTLTILSPVDGRVLRVITRDTSVLTAGADLLELGDPGDLEMEIDVLSTDAVKIQPGAAVYIEHWGGEGVLEGIVRLVEPSAFLKVSALGVEEQRVNVIADFTSSIDKRETLGDGFRIEASIVVDVAVDAVKVPSGTLFLEDGAWSVFQVRDGRAHLQSVQVGRTNGLETEITQGVSPGDFLILHPTDKIEDGSPVAPF